MTKKTDHPLTLVYEARPQGKTAGKTRRDSPIIYQSKNQKWYEAALRKIAVAKMVANGEVDEAGEVVPWEGPIETVVRIYHPIPKGLSKLRYTMARNGELRPLVKPDADNVEKSINDAMKSVIFKDDNQIVETKRSKLFGVIPRIEVEVKRWKYE